MSRTLLSKMTVTRFSVVYSRVFMALFIWACTAVVCLVEEKVTVQPMTVGYHSTDMMTTANATGQDNTSFACGSNSDSCIDFCIVCHNMYGPNTTMCLHDLFSHICVRNFETTMASLNSTDWCVWGKVNSLYSNLSMCTEEICDCLRIPWPNPLVEKTFVDIHSKFFKDCPTEELSDPPPAIVFALVITPICLIPVMVSLVVLKTKNGDGSS